LQLFACLCMELPVILLMSTCEWARPPSFSRCTNSAKRWLRCLALSTLKSPMYCSTIVDQWVKEVFKMMGSIDCMHWEWKKCPFAWQVKNSGHAEGYIVILEAVASQDRWI
jgi:hypothetical protein